MTLRDYILNYKDNDGNIVVNLFDYYEYYIKPLDKRFSRYSYYNDKLVLCWFKDHNDINPSMGYVRTKKSKNIHLYHCLGCGKTGDVVRLNQIIMSMYHGKELSEKESCLDLASKFKIPLDEFSEIADDDFEGRYEINLIKIDKLQSRYTERDFSNNLLNIRKRGSIDLGSVNSECIKMIATKKLLYD